MVSGGAVTSGELAGLTLRTFLSLDDDVFNLACKQRGLLSASTDQVRKLLYEYPGTLAEGYALKSTTITPRTCAKYIYMHGFKQLGRRFT